ncbi:MAG TPA: hypothetical protein DIS95_03480 [Proteus vulgaris]|uniref:hypothetical protein n=1 Tax=Proteus terrae TaxID=1574161 RepID=UPI000BFC365B|nr:hypothetical protein CRN77_15230 [Proteus vulgaris]HCN41463.1 hypothetical protein [Proteus vulgaris]
MNKNKKAFYLLGALIIVLLASTIIFNRMYMNYKDKYKKLYNETLSQTIIDNGLNIEYTGTDQIMKSLFENTTKDCGSSIAPSYECSGLVIHGLRLQEQDSPWSHREIDENKSVAFSYLRNDHRFESSADYASGIILYPLQNIPTEKNKYTVLCAYPIDGSTDAKKSHNLGCGNLVDETLNDYYSDELLKKIKKLGIEKNSGNCLDYGLDTAKKWFNFHTKNNYFQDDSIITNMYTCSYPMSGDNSALSFNILSEIRDLLDNTEHKPDNWNNELLISAWDPSKPQELPIMSFFYTIGNNSSLNSALLYQRSFYDKTGEVIPVVGIKYPVNNTDEVIFKEYTKKH